MPIHDWTRVDAGLFHDFHQKKPTVPRGLRFPPISKNCWNRQQRRCSKASRTPPLIVSTSGIPPQHAEGKVAAQTLGIGEVDPEHGVRLKEARR